LTVAKQVNAMGRSMRCLLCRDKNGKGSQSDV
jgi:hypothetical protein